MRSEMNNELKKLRDYKTMRYMWKESYIYGKEYLRVLVLQSWRLVTGWQECIWCVPFIDILWLFCRTIY